jgi:outer membrane protein
MEADQRLRNEAEAIARDVRSAWANATVGYRRMAVTTQMVQQALLALDLAQQRYQLGLSTIVELTDAQLNVTTAQVENVNAQYDYQSQYAALQYAIGALR